MMRLNQVLAVSFSLMLAVMLLATPMAVRAAEEPPTPEELQITAIKCEPQPGELTHAIYRCIREKLDAMSADLVIDIYNQVSKVVASVLILAIMFFAIKYILYGTRQPQAEFAVMMLKFIIVATLVIGIKDGHGMLDLRDTILHAGAGFQNLVLVGDGTFGVDGNNIFERMDNMLFRIYGVENPDTIKMDKDMAGIGMMGGLLLAGPVGAKAFVDGGAAIGMIIGAFMIALYITIVSLIALTFLFALSPIVLPLLLFRPTERMFQKWRGQVISYSLQPMIMTVFLSMMFIILGGMMGTLDNFIKTAREMGNDPGVSSIKHALTTATVHKDPNKPGVDVNTGTESVPLLSSVTGGQDVKGLGVEQHVDMITRGIASENVKVPILPFDQTQMKGLGSQMVVLLIVCGAMFRFMRELPAWATELAGGDRTVPNLVTSPAVQQAAKPFDPGKR